MSKDLNLCQFIGRLGAAPEQRFMPDGTSVVNFSLAVGNDYKDKNTGRKVEQTEWVRCVAFGRTSEVISEFCDKGSRIYASGKFRTRSYEKDGQKHHISEVVINEMQMLDQRRDNGGQQDQYAGYAGGQQHSYPQDSYQQQRRQGGETRMADGRGPVQQNYQQQNRQQAPAQEPAGFDGFDDDIPFS